MPSIAEHIVVEEVPETPAPLTVEWEGELFEVAEKVGIMPLLEFAHLAQDGVDSDDLEGLAAIHNVLRECLTDDGWVKFKRHATKIKASTAQMLPLVGLTAQVITGRPTQPVSASSGGSPATQPSSVDGSPLQRVLARHSGRPDLQLVVVNAHRRQLEQGSTDSA